MTTQQKTNTLSPWVSLIWTPVLLGIAIGYLHWVVDPQLFHQASSGVYNTSGSYLWDFLKRPGGSAQYVEALLLHYYGQGWIGTFGHGMVLLLMAGSSAGLVFGIRRRLPVILHLLPAGVLFLLVNQYSYPWLETGLSMILAISGIAAVAGLPLQPVIRWIGIAAGAILAGWLGGGLSFSVFFLGTGALEAASCRRYWAGLAILLVGFVAGSVFVYPFHNAAALMRIRWGSSFCVATTLMLVVTVPLLILWLGLVKNAEAKPAPSVKRKPMMQTRPDFLARCKRLTQEPRIQIAAVFVFLVVSGLVLRWTFNPAMRAFLKLERMATYQVWPEMLRIRASLPSANNYLGLCTIRALFETGALPGNQFSYITMMGEDLMPIYQMGLRSYGLYADTLAELGQVNLAEHWANEALENEGETAFNLLLLARINLLKNRPLAARVFLNRLRLIPASREHAERLLATLDAGSAADEWPGIARIRAILVKTDSPGSTTDTETLLQQCLDSNSGNRMAFEYLMAHYLFTLRLERFAQQIGRVTLFAYPNIPRHYEEAILLHQSLYPNAPINLKSLQIRTETAQRFRQFTTRIAQFKGDLTSAYHGLKAEFGDTFWFYYQFHETPGLVLGGRS